MAWLKVDDGFYTSSKVLSIPRSQRLAAVGLWLMAGNWAARELSDGVVPNYVLKEIGATPRLRQALVEARLWLDRGSGEAGSIEFHAWAEYQPTRDQIEDKREKARIRKEKSRMSRRDSAVTEASVTKASHDSRPDPTRPLIDTSSNEELSMLPRKRGSRIPEPFIVTTDMRDWATTEVPTVDVDATTRKFVDYWRAKSGKDATKQDWTATWRNWLRTDADRRKPSRPIPPDKDQRALDVIEMGRRLAANRQEITA